MNEDMNSFVDALQWVNSLNQDERHTLRLAAKDTAREFSIEETAKKALNLYTSLIEKNRGLKAEEDHSWSDTLDFVKTEWDLLENLIEATGAAFGYHEIPEKNP